MIGHAKAVRLPELFKMVCAHGFPSFLVLLELM